MGSECKLYRSTVSSTYGSPLATGVATNSYKDGTVVAGVTYYCTVKASNSSGDSAPLTRTSVAIPNP